MDDFKFNKSLGQNFLYDENILNKIVDAAQVDKDTLVIEVGPGSGNLSKKIIPLVKNAILYEIDSRLESVLKSELKDYDNYELIIGDFLLQDITNDIKKYDFKKLYFVANVPYYITTPILTKVINDLHPDKILVLVQDEVASRLSAKPHTRDYGMITVLLGSQYDISKKFKVGRNCFRPVPNVDSAVVEMKKSNQKILNYDTFNRFIKDAFSYKRKTLRNNLKKYDVSLIEKILNKYSLSLSNRAEDVPVNVYVEIANSLN